MIIFKVIRRGSDDLYLLDRFPNKLNNSGDTLTYFIYGEGNRKTKRFEVLNEDLPQPSNEISWFDICKIHEKYGIEVSSEYSERKVAGIIARQTIRGKYCLYEKIKDIIPNDTKFYLFFDLLRCEYMLSCFGMFLFDLIGLDETLSKLDSDYDCENSTYKGKECSMNEYISIKYGFDYVKVIERLIDCTKK